MKITINAKDLVLGRLASYAAKQALLGHEIVILNCNEIKILGNKRSVINQYLRRVHRKGGSLKGPKLHRNPERIVKRTVRGMLSHKETRGAAALKRVMCFNEIPEKYKSEKPLDLKKSDKQGIKLKELVKEL